MSSPRAAQLFVRPAQRAVASWLSSRRLKQGQPSQQRAHRQPHNAQRPFGQARGYAALQNQHGHQCQQHHIRREEQPLDPPPIPSQRIFFPRLPGLIPRVGGQMRAPAQQPSHAGGEADTLATCRGRGGRGRSARGRHPTQQRAQSLPQNWSSHCSSVEVLEDTINQKPRMAPS